MSSSFLYLRLSRFSTPIFLLIYTSYIISEFGVLGVDDAALGETDTNKVLYIVYTIKVHQIKIGI